jgi:hypothetical protein
MASIKEIHGAGWNQLELALKNLGNKVGKVGWFEDSKYDDDKNTPVAFVAAQNEFGNRAKNIPERPFMRPTIIAKQNEWRKIALDGSKKIIKGELNSYNVLDILGLKVVGDIKATIQKIQEPVLSPVTIKNRLARRANKKTVGWLTKPLIDTGVMFNTITNSVEDI